MIGGTLDTPEERLHFTQTLLADPALTSLDNGITLCETCHQKTHDGLHVYQRPRRSYGRKVSLEQREQIKRLYAAGGITQKQLGERFGVNQPHISWIVRL